MKPRMKVLVSVYACRPDEGSEPGVGWNWVKQSARFHEVWAITRAEHREAIEQVLQQEPLPNVHWIYFDLPRWARFWKKGQRGIRVYYYLWQIGAYFLGKKLHRTVSLDLVHHITFVNYWMPSFLALLPVPFVWGPVGGGESSPKAFLKIFTLRGKVYERLRDLARTCGEHDPFVRLTAKHTQLAFAATRDTEARLQRMRCKCVQVLPSVAIASDEITRLKRTPSRQGHPFRLVSIGTLLHLKAFNLGLTAFARFQQAFPESEYYLIGDGVERRNLERMAQRLGVADKVRFWGHLSRQQVLEKLAECDVLLHPSLHESGGWVSLEAMAAGCPVICLDIGGPALQITEETGFKVPAITPEQVVNDLSKAMLWLAHHPDQRQRMIEAGQKRVAEHFDWDKKGEWMRDMYREVIGSSKGSGVTSTRTTF